MPKLIKDNQVCDNSWLWLSAVDAEPADVLVPADKVIVPLRVWQAQQSRLAARENVGVWLDSHEQAEDIGEDAAKLPLIAIHFPSFMDGRGFSIGRKLRDQFQFDGELRATGYILRDQFFFLRRCGFDALAPTNDMDLEAALASLNDFSESYQSAVDQPRPLFQRRQ